MLPPDSTATTGGRPPTAPAISAATPTAPAGSTTSLSRSMSMTIARAMSSSVTVTTSSTSSLMWANVMSPGRPTAMPSAIVANDSSRPAGPP